MLRYAITSRTVFPGDDVRRQAALVSQCALWAGDGIDFIQLREKDLAGAELASLARRVLSVLDAAGSDTKLLINSRPDIALVTGAPGVHLTGAPSELIPVMVRKLYADTGQRPPLLSVSTHAVAEAIRARDDGADVILFAPVFEKSIDGKMVTAGHGLDQLRSVCDAASPVRVFALGGVTLEDAASCVAAGAAGVAGIRLFHDRSLLEDEGGDERAGQSLF